VLGRHRPFNFISGYVVTLYLVVFVR